MVVGGRNRVSWADLPAVVRAEVEERLGGSVRSATSMPGGFTPGLASVLESDSGLQVFVKAISAAVTPEGPAIYRREATVSAALPSAAPAPRLRWWFELADWVVLAFEHVDGRPPDLSRPDDAVAVLDVYSRLAASLDPAPLRAPPFAEACADDFGNWAAFCRQGVPPGLVDLGSWIPRTVPRLAELEAAWARASAGTCLLHGDLRADNMLITATGDVVVVDWPEACVGGPWVDLVLALPSFALLGLDPEHVVRRHPLTRDVEAPAIDALIAAVAGFFASRCLLPAPPGLPTVRDFQRRQAVAALLWLRARDGRLADG